MIKKLLFIPASLILFVTISYLLIKTVATGGFEKELIPAFSESQTEWKDLNGPLLKSYWKQDSGYAEFTPNNELLGCWSVAFAQVLAFHQLQPTGKVFYTTSDGIAINQELTHINFNRIASLIDSNTPPESSSETAKYCYQVALVIQKDFGQGEYKDISSIPDEVSQHYHCYVKQHDSDLLEILNTEINSGCPVIAYFDDILAIKLVKNGHAAVIDGIARLNNQAFVHLNFGWGGKSDGWYNFKTISAERKLKYIFTIRT